MDPYTQNVQSSGYGYQPASRADGSRGLPSEQAGTYQTADMRASPLQPESKFTRVSFHQPAAGGITQGYGYRQPSRDVQGTPSYTAGGSYNDMRQYSVDRSSGGAVGAESANRSLEYTDKPVTYEAQRPQFNKLHSSKREPRMSSPHSQNKTQTQTHKPDDSSSSTSSCPAPPCPPVVMALSGLVVLAGLIVGILYWTGVLWHKKEDGDYVMVDQVRYPAYSITIENEQIQQTFNPKTLPITANQDRSGLPIEQLYSNPDNNKDYVKVNNQDYEVTFKQNTKYVNIDGKEYIVSSGNLYPTLQQPTGKSVTINGQEQFIPDQSIELEDGTETPPGTRYVVIEQKKYPIEELRDYDFIEKDGVKNVLLEGEVLPVQEESNGDRYIKWRSNKYYISPEQQIKIIHNKNDTKTVVLQGKEYPVQTVGNTDYFNANNAKYMLMNGEYYKVNNQNGKQYADIYGIRFQKNPSTNDMEVKFDDKLYPIASKGDNTYTQIDNQLYLIHNGQKYPVLKNQDGEAYITINDKDYNIGEVPVFPKAPVSPKAPPKYRNFHTKPDGKDYIKMQDGTENQVQKTQNTLFTTINGTEYILSSGSLYPTKQEKDGKSVMIQTQKQFIPNYKTTLEDGHEYPSGTRSVTIDGKDYPISNNEDYDLLRIGEQRYILLEGSHLPIQQQSNGDRYINWKNNKYYVSPAEVVSVITKQDGSEDVLFHGKKYPINKKGTIQDFSVGSEKYIVLNGDIFKLQNDGVSFFMRDGLRYEPDYPKGDINIILNDKPVPTTIKGGQVFTNGQVQNLIYGGQQLEVKRQSDGKAYVEKDGKKYFIDAPEVQPVTYPQQE